MKTQQRPTPAIARQLSVQPVGSSHAREIKWKIKSSSNTFSLLRPCFLANDCSVQREIKRNYAWKCTRALFVAAHSPSLSVPPQSQPPPHTALSSVAAPRNCASNASEALTHDIASRRTQSGNLSLASLYCSNGDNSARRQDWR